MGFVPGDARLWLDRRVRSDLAATIRFNLMMAGVWLGDAELTALVDALAARLDGEWRARQLQPPPLAPVGGSA